MSLYRSRRSLKPSDMDSTQNVDINLLESLLEDAIWAPTHKLHQPWRFHVFASPNARASLADALSEIYDTITPAPLHDASKRAKLDSFIRLAPVVITIAAKLEVPPTLPDWEEYAAVGCAVQNLMLSAHEHGLGTFWATPPTTRSPQFSQWLGFDTSHHPMGLLFLGYPNPALPPKTSTRHPLAHSTTWHL